ISGTATYTTTALQPGTHGITANYQGDVNFVAGSNPPSVTQTVGLGNTQITLQHSPASPTINSSVTYSVALTGGPTPPAGSVTILDGSPAVCTISSVTVGSGSSTGSCSVNYNGSDAAHSGGTHNMTAAYTPTAGTCTGGSNCWTQATSTVDVVVVGGQT